VPARAVQTSTTEAAVAEVLLQPAVPGSLEVAVVRPGVEALTTAALAAAEPGAAAPQTTPYQSSFALLSALYLESSRWFLKRDDLEQSQTHSSNHDLFHRVVGMKVVVVRPEEVVLLPLEWCALLHLDQKAES